VRAEWWDDRVPGHVHGLGDSAYGCGVFGGHGGA
jgi:hypothetical protein